MSDSEEDLGFQLKGLKLSHKHEVHDQDDDKHKDVGDDVEGSQKVDVIFSNEEKEAENTFQLQDKNENVLGTQNKNSSEIAEASQDMGETRDGDLSQADTKAKQAELDELEVDKSKPNVLPLPEEMDSDMNSDSDSDGWQNMPAIASFNVYNEKGELEIRPYQNTGFQNSSQEILSRTTSDSVTSEKRKSTTFGYTKVAAEEQAQRSYKTNRKTDFLFDHKRLSRMNNSRSSLNGKRDSMPLPPSESDADNEKEMYDEFEEEVEPMNDINADTQLNVTRNLLDEKEKFAYVGAINVLANQMCTDLATLCLCVDITSHRKLAQRLQFAQKDSARWKTEVLTRLYEHLGLTAEEIRMIEKLSMHGIHLEDLCKCLKTTQDIENPFEENKDNAESFTTDDNKLGNKEQSSENNMSESDEGEETFVKADTEVQEVILENKEHSEDVTSAPKNVIHPEALQDQDILQIDVAWTIICDLFLILLQDAVYDARSRTLLLKFANLLNIANLEICEFERRVTDSLDMEQSTEDQVWNETQHMKDRRKRRRRRKMCYVGLAMVGGSLVLGLSGGLLAPVIGAGIAAGLSTVGITGATGFLTGAGGATVVALTSTAIGGNIGARGMSKRMGSVRTFEFRPLHNNRRVNLIISVSGWMIGNDDDVRLPYSTVDPVEGDLYALHWEPEMLKSIGQTINIVANELFTQALQQVLGATILTAFISAIQWPMGLSKLGYILDNPWSVSLDRAWAAGLILADTLISRNLGQRPITLMGFSLGSRVIYSCLVELCRRKAHGLVENVYIFGTPVVRKREHLVMARSAVSDRFVNAFSGKDWMLAYLFRAAAGGFSKVMGIAPIEDIEGIENFDCTDVVDGHLAYRKNMPKLLKRMGIAVVSEEFVEIEETVDPEQLQRRRKLVHDVDAAQKKLLEKKKHSGWMPKWLKPKKSRWRAMVEDAVGEAKDMEDPSVSKDEEPIKPKRKDNALVDHGALMYELQQIKAALREEKIKNELDNTEIDGSTNLTSDEPSEGNAQTLARPVNKPPQSPNNFQLLGAGRTILPEDEEMHQRKKNMTFAFSDDL